LLTVCFAWREIAQLSSGQDRGPNFSYRHRFPSQPSSAEIQTTSHLSEPRSCDYEDSMNFPTASVYIQSLQVTGTGVDAFAWSNSTECIGGRQSLNPRGAQLTRARRCPAAERFSPPTVGTPLIAGMQHRMGTNCFPERNRSGEFVRRQNQAFQEV
jgi:hypothetical protein